MSIKQINDAKDILALQNGDFVSKHSLYNIIIFSKNPFSINYLGPEYEIKNSPQQGINWIGSDYKPKAVLVKSKFGCYYQDSHNEYAFKARNGYVNKFEKANQVLVNQPRYKYPIMYFKEWGDSWRFLGRFKVVEIKDRSVVLSPFEGEEEVCELNKENNISQLQELEKDEKEWCELTKKKYIYQPPVQEKDDPIVEIAKVCIETIIAKRSVSPVNGKCKFLKNDDTFIFADEKGMENPALPWSGQYVKINVFQKDNEILTDWSWCKLD